MFTFYRCARQAPAIQEGAVPRFYFYVSSFILFYFLTLTHNPWEKNRFPSYQKSRIGNWQRSEDFIMVVCVSVKIYKEFYDVIVIRRKKVLKDIVQSQSHLLKMCQISGEIFFQFQCNAARRICTPNFVKLKKYNFPR